MASRTSKLPTSPIDDYEDPKSRLLRIKRRKKGSSAETENDEKAQEGENFFDKDGDISPNKPGDKDTPQHEDLETRKQINKEVSQQVDTETDKHETKEPSQHVNIQPGSHSDSEVTEPTEKGSEPLPSVDLFSEKGQAQGLQDQQQGHISPGPHGDMVSEQHGNNQASQHVDILPEKHEDNDSNQHRVISPGTHASKEPPQHTVIPPGTPDKIGPSQHSDMSPSGHVDREPSQYAVIPPEKYTDGEPYHHQDNEEVNPIMLLDQTELSSYRLSRYTFYLRDGQKDLLEAMAAYFDVPEYHIVVHSIDSFFANLPSEDKKQIELLQKLLGKKQRRKKG